MNQNMGRLIRYILIINKLSGKGRYIPADELIQYLNIQMEVRGYDIGISLRTLQRDFKDIEEMFDIVIKKKRDIGYYIVDTYESPTCDYNSLLMNFDLLTSVSYESRSAGYILPEHHRPKGSDNMPLLIASIKNCSVVSFDYCHVRKGCRLIHKKVKPHFLKESLGLWYLLALDENGKLKCYGIDRISNLEESEEKFERDSNIEIGTLFNHSYGIWDDPSIPVEYVELSYSPLDGSFLKAMPLHTSQQILIDNEDEFRISLNIKITNDFVMALLSRSTSLTVIKPESLRNRVAEIYHNALKRNS